jgi:hypothetical protein
MIKFILQKKNVKIRITLKNERIKSFEKIFCYSLRYDFKNLVSKELKSK